MSEILNLYVEKPLDNRPYISVKRFDCDITALLDTGATVSVIGSLALPLIHNFWLKITPVRSKTIHTAYNTSICIEGVVDLPIVVEGVCQIIKCYVVPNLPRFIILGCLC